MKSIASILLFVFGSLFVAAVWIATLCTSQEKFGTASLDPLFTGLALVAAIAVFAHEREKSDDADKAHAELIEEMRTACRVQAITTKIGRYDLMKKGVGEPDLNNAVVHMSINQDSKKLEAELDRVLGIQREG